MCFSSQNAEAAGKQEAKKTPVSPQALIDQSDMYTHVFTVFVDNKVRFLVIYTLWARCNYIIQVGSNPVGSYVLSP
jgi:hypothetical protein